jgi:hypothetical protein
MFGHVLNANDFMVGYRYMYSRQSGGMRHGSDAVDDAEVKANGCNADGCLMRPNGMGMHMHMLELMYAPTNWVTLMLMPQYMDMNMSQVGLLTQSEQFALPFAKNALYEHHTTHAHTSGGIGDTGLYASFKVLDQPGHNLLATVGFTAPTGSVNVKLRDTHQLDAGFQHYHMQLGSGTWDFNPSITYTGLADKWFWGAQLSGTVRLEDRNKSGYALGNIFQSTLWGGYQLPGGWSASLRGVYTRQGAIKGEFNDTFYALGPVDYPGNYGGRFWDVGVGITIPSGAPLRAIRSASSGCNRSRMTSTGTSSNARACLTRRGCTCSDGEPPPRSLRSLPPEGTQFAPWGGPAARRRPPRSLRSLPPEGVQFAPWGGPAARMNYHAHFV